MFSSLPMSANELDPLLSEVAAQVADGTPVDWQALASAASSHVQRQQIDRLRKVADLIALQSSGSVASHFPLAAADPLIDASMGLRPGASWAHLHIRERVGEGRYGVVYRAWDPTLEREVALKILRQRDEVAERHVVHEGRMMARVHHPNVVAVYGAQAIDDHIGIWMQFIPGRTLEAELRESGPFAAGEIVKAARDLCDALTAVHAVGLLHRDVKAHNVMRDLNGRLVLGDFGTGRLHGQDDSGIAGTPLYLAPEILSGCAADERSDIYSLGVLLFHLASASYPVAGDSIRELRDAHSLRRRRLIAVERPDLPAYVAKTIDRATSPNPAERFASAAEMQRALAATSGRLTRRTVARTALVLAVGVGAIALTALRFPVPASRNVPAPFPIRSLLVGSFTSADQSDLAQSVAYALARELEASTDIRVSSQARIDDTLRLMKRPPDAVLDRSTAREVCLRDDVSTFIIGRLDATGGRLQLSATIVDASTGISIAEVSANASAVSELPAAIATLARHTREQLGSAAVNPADVLEPVTTPSLEALRLYTESYRLGARNEWTAALELSKRAVETDPTFATARIWLAWCLFRANAAPAEYRVVAGEALKMAGQTSSWERAWIEGSYYSLIGDDQRAIAYYEAVLKLRPHHYWAAGNVATAYGRLGKFAEAVPVAAALAEIRPDDHRTLNIAFSAVRRASRFEEASDIARRMREVHEREHRYWLADAWLFDAYRSWSAGDHRRARAAADALTARLPALPDDARASIVPETAHLFLALGRPADATRVLALLPNGPQRNLHLAITALHKGDLVSARDLARRASSGANDLRDVWDRIWILSRTGANDDARRLIAHLRQSAPSSTQMVEASRYRNEWMDAAEGEVRFADRRTHESAQLLRRALPGLIADVTVTPAQMYRAAETLADASVAAGRHQEAIEVLRGVLSRAERTTFAGAPLWSARCRWRLEQLQR